MSVDGLILTLIVAGGLLNVWVVRIAKRTRFRGGEAKSLKQEFEVYGLPDFMFYVVGGLKIACAVSLVASLWVPFLRIYAASLIVVLMLGALMMHFKIRDPFVKSVPALAMLAMSLSLLLL